MADTVNGLFISELLADNAGGQAVDTDGDGNTNKADEFIEIQNTSGSPMSLDGFALWSEANGELFSFGPGDTIAAGGTATVLGNYTGTPPAGFFSSGLPENGNFIPDGEGNKSDTIYLVNTNTGEYVTLSYGKPPPVPNPPAGFPGTTQIGTGEQINSTAPNGTAFFRDADGTLVEGNPTPGTPDIPCFVSGTLIETEHGPCPVEQITPGMRLLTLDAGYEPVQAVRQVVCTAQDLAGHPHLRPIVLPSETGRALRVSPSHRIYLNSDAAELLFGASQVLAPATAFVGFAGSHIEAVKGPVRYIHLLLDAHHVIKADGLWAETLFLGDLISPAIAHRTGWAIAPGFDLARAHHEETARPILRTYETRLLLAKDGPLRQIA